MTPAAVARRLRPELDSLLAAEAAIARSTRARREAVDALRATYGDLGQQCLTVPVRHELGMVRFTRLSYLLAGGERLDPGGDTPEDLHRLLMDFAVLLIEQFGAPEQGVSGRVDVDRTPACVITAGRQCIALLSVAINTLDGDGPGDGLRDADEFLALLNARESEGS